MLCSFSPRQCVAVRMKNLRTARLSYFKNAIVFNGIIVRGACMKEGQ